MGRRKKEIVPYSNYHGPKYKRIAKGLYINIYGEELPDGGIGKLKLTASHDSRRQMRLDRKQCRPRLDMGDYMDDHLGNGWQYGDADKFNIAMCSLTDIIGRDLEMDDEGIPIVKDDSDMWYFRDSWHKDPIKELIEGRAVIYERI